MNNKTVSLDEMAEICQKSKDEGKSVVHCHGCFDLLHPGHIKYLNSAKKMGNLLIVTLTPDGLVNKGPGRPVFNEELRMESIASLECVDYVALNKWPDAIETIKLLKPSFYVKGRDYAERKKEKGQKLPLEKEAVESAGGQLRFTDDIVFSSSKIINEHMSPLTKKAKEYVTEIKKKFDYEHIKKIIDSLSDIKVTVLGDIIIDNYTYCRAMGRPEKAAVVSVNILRDRMFAGGSLAVANHIAGFAGKVNLISWAGSDMEGFVRESLDKKVDAFLVQADMPTIVKKRYIETFRESRLFEVTNIRDAPINEENEKKIIEKIRHLEKETDVFIIADFGHGLMTEKIIQSLPENSFIAVNAQTNSANFGFNMITKYRGVNFISLDEREVRLPYHDKHSMLEDLIKKLASDTKCGKINLTLGDAGSMYYNNGTIHRAPVLSTDVVDTVGAGDAVLSITSLLAFMNADPELITFIGNSMGAMAVKIVGNEKSVEPKELKKFINYMMK